MRLSRAVILAILAVRDLAKFGEHGPVLGFQNDRSHQLSERFTTQILENLALKKVLLPVADRNPAYALARPLGDISLLELIEGVDGPLIGSAPDDVRLPEESQRVLQALCEDIAAVVRARLSRVMVADLSLTHSGCIIQEIGLSTD
jgi:DNA-binding IscR family transcriptional regulator